MPDANTEEDGTPLLADLPILAPLSTSLLI